MTAGERENKLENTHINSKTPSQKPGHLLVFAETYALVVDTLPIQSRSIILPNLRLDRMREVR
jgi:hypothetical protein